MTGYIISFLIGYFLLHVLLKDARPLTFPFCAALSFAVGLGFTSLLTFYNFLIFNRFHSLIILLLNGAFLVYLLVASFQNRHSISFCLPKKPDWGALIRWPVWLILTWVTFYIATTHPFGEWDAWAIWNLKTKFLIFGAEHWRAIFDELHWHTHPDYPLFLPLINTWLYAFHYGALHPLPMMTATILPIACSFVIYGALQQRFSKTAAFLASCLCLVQPYFVVLSTMQYADILSGFYLVTAIAVLFLLIRTQETAYAILAGFILGFMAFSKNEGIVMSVYLIGLASTYLGTAQLFDKKKRVHLLPFLWGAFLIAASPTIIVKLFLAPPNDDILPALTAASSWHISINELQVLFTLMAKEILHPRWCYIWIFIGGLLLLGIRKIFIKENIIATIFFFLYAVTVIWIYLVGQPDVSLTWWVKHSFDRILQTLLPALVFFAFYVNWHSDKETPKD